MASAAFALLLILAAQMLTAIGAASAVVDEPAHLTSGYLAITQGDLTVNREHPPLVKVLAALPVVPLHPVVPPDPPGGPPRGSEDYEFGASRRFLYEANDADRLLSAARLPIVGLAVLAGLVLFLWGRALIGDSAALAGLALMVFEPNILAHGRLVTTDMGATLFALATFACLERSFARSTRLFDTWRVATGLFLGLGLLTRFSSLLLIPLMALIVAFCGKGTAASRAREFVVILAVAVIVVNIGYGMGNGGVTLFPFAGDRISGPFQTAPFLAMSESPTLRWTPLPIPKLFLEGLDLARYKNAHVEGPGYLNGVISAEGWWSWFVQALAMKTTIPLLALSTAGFVLLGRRARDAASRALFVHLLVPCAGFLLLVTALSRAQIGLRYILPIFPFLCLAAGYAAGELRRRSRGLALGLAGSLLVWHAWSALSIHPYHLAYFNEAAGGPRNGYRHLVDSNLDWGQDLAGLKQFMNDRAIPRIHLFYFGTADPSHYGIERETPGVPGYFAVSATHLMGVYLPDPDYFAPFRDLAPAATIGHSIHVYHLDTFPPFLKTPIRRK